MFFILIYFKTITKNTFRVKFLKTNVNVQFIDEGVKC